MTTNQSPLLTHGECTMLKAIAMLMIMAHNFAHHVKGIVSENEYTLDPHRTTQLIHNVLHPDSHIALHVLSFFGHYGVPLFLFLSGYGLVMKYERGQRGIPSPLRFIGLHYAKLFKLMLVGLLCFLCLRYLSHKPVLPVNVGAQLTMVVNLLSEPWMRIQPGPYWFFGLMLQLYVLYRLVLHPGSNSRHWRWLGPVLLIAVCHVVQVVGMRYGGRETLYWMRYNALVAGLPFGMGLLTARYPWNAPHGRALGWGLAALAGVAVTAMNLRFQTWLVAPAVVVAGGVALVRVLPRWTHGFLLWTGTLSPMLFAVHPIARFLMLDHANVSHPQAWLLAYLGLSLALAVAYRRLLAFADTHLPQRN